MAQESDRSHLFVVRLWNETAVDDQHEYRGRVQHALSGETAHFRDWSSMIEFIVSQMEVANENDDDPQ